MMIKVIVYKSMPMVIDIDSIRMAMKWLRIRMGIISLLMRMGIEWRGISMVLYLCTIVRIIWW